ncbi:hypothetical protein A966_09506 [Brachyspira hampsonii 30446]|uniref:Uncharacterized protein n=1 Tax=Brachyspira hampsonii 30446 TaxID=1289135 RepID=A0A2U4F654_9SPIR|nr:hypothetical protein [Brachyspira hampsonii]EKV56540.1 hypothetical protein A966_09506 [Brachyspira hampsonii 30446]MBW5395979.1 hypothetical protein [Brachyspira hampsonii]OEJ18203.1 hypothetical protein A9495_06265 [Brachyspira hampsonii]
MCNYKINFSNPIHYEDINNLTTKNGIYYIFFKRYGEDYQVHDIPLYIGKVCREDKKSKGIQERIKEHFSLNDDKINNYIHSIMFYPKDNQGIITLQGTQDNIELLPAVYVAYCELDESEDIEKIEAALIYDNRDKLILNEKGKESYNKGNIIIDIEGETYGLKSHTSLQN